MNRTVGRVRMADIAQQVGVSTVTVHNALTGQKGVSDELREKIRQAADELGYEQRIQPSRGKSRGAGNVGVLIPEKYLDEYTTFYWKMYQEMVIAATDRACTLAVEILKEDVVDNMVLPRIVENRSVEGLVMMGEVSQAYIYFIKKYADMPIVFMDFYSKELSDDDVVISDNFYGMYLMTEHLFRQGFRRIAYVGSIHATSSIMDRYCGYMKAMLEHGQVQPPEWLIEDRDLVSGEIKIRLPENMPDAFVCNCDLTAGMLILQLEERGYRIPEDISVVGFDNFLYPGFPEKKITSYGVNFRAMADAVLEKVLAKINNEAYRPGLEIVSGRIIEKDSVRRM